MPCSKVTLSAQQPGTLQRSRGTEGFSSDLRTVVCVMGSRSSLPGVSMLSYFSQKLPCGIC